MVDTPPFHEFLILAAGELRSTVSAEAEWNTDLPEVSAEDLNGVGSCSVAFAWDDNRSACVCDNKEGFP